MSEVGMANANEPGESLAHRRRYHTRLGALFDLEIDVHSNTILVWKTELFEGCEGSSYKAEIVRWHTTHNCLPCMATTLQ